MTKQIPPNHNKDWSKTDLETLKHMDKIGKVTPIIAWELGRTVDAIRAKASDKNISLMPVNKSPNKNLKPPNK